MRFAPRRTLVPTRASTVLPGKFAVALRKPHSRLNNVVFPTFGFPRIKTDDATVDSDSTREKPLTSHCIDHSDAPKFVLSLHETTLNELLQLGQYMVFLVGTVEK